MKMAELISQTHKKLGKTETETIVLSSSGCEKLNALEKNVEVFLTEICDIKYIFLFL